MIEIPESATIGKQASETLKGKRIAHVIESNSPHRFTFYNGDPAEYSNRLVGRTVLGAQGYGAFVDILMDADTHLLIGDGTNMRYYTSAEKAPKKYQLMIVFEDDSFLAFTVSMYGSIYAFKGEFDNPYYQGSIHKLCPFNARISPKRKISTLSEEDIDRLFNTVKSTLEEMTRRGGRDTEKDLYGALGNYRTILSKNTYHDPCSICGERIQKEAYLGGSIYYCPHCQRER